MDIQAIIQGLELSLMSILTTFLALGMFIGIILLLRVAFPMQPRHRKIEEEDEGEAPEREEEIIINLTASAEEGDDALTAAIAAALYVKNTYQPAARMGTPAVIRRSPGGLGARLEQPRSRWWQSTDNQ
jgi:hypothetical protein